ncbi:MAG: peptidase M14 [Phycisphaerae bacterium]|nr:peptidase M14 [Phycisphaerae bacterium]
MNHARRTTGTALALAMVAVAVVTTPVLAQYFYESKVDLRFDRLYDYTEMSEALRELVDAYPDLLSLESIGQSVGGRELWLVTLNNPRTGPDTSKTAMYIDGNIHGNEVQAAEVVLYSIWYLTKTYGKIDYLTRIVDERAFYFLPMANPDGREIWFHEAATPSYQRGGIRPTDNDYDGEYDEDAYDDLDGDGHITSMWKKDPLGRYERDPDDERFFIRVGRDEEPGGWTNLGSEGLDNDGDGRVNEDGPGGYDPNRNWPSDWQPNYVQRGAGEYPFSLPETKAVGDFLMAHPNVAAFQSYHNSGGMILRGPAASYLTYPGEDVRVYTALQDMGEKLLPFYRAFVTHKDLYTVHGGEKGWAYEGLGIFGFTNELWTNAWMFKSERPSQDDRKLFRKLLQFEEVYVPYKPYDHPTYGEILIGGTKKWSSRVAPPWMLEEECHRNFAFTMFHADEMPMASWGHLQVRQRSSGVWEITVAVRNDKIIPTIAAIARSNGIGARDALECRTPPEATVVAGGTVRSFLPWSELNATEDKRPHLLWNASGVSGKGRRLFRFLVRGQGTVELEYRSEKGGTISLQVPLEAREASPVDDEGDDGA